MARPREAVAVENKAREILKDIKSPKLDPDVVLGTLKTKLIEARKTNDDIKNGTLSTGIPKEQYGGLAFLETLVEAKCSKKAGFFKNRREELERKQKEEDQTKKVEAEKQAKIKERHEREREKASAEAEAQHAPGNINLGHYDEVN